MRFLARRPLAALLAAAFATAAHAALDVKGMDKSIGACGDFYMYANAKWFAENEIPADRSFWGSGSKLARDNENLLIRTLDEASRAKLPPPGSPIRKVIEYYMRGMDESNIRHWQLKPLAPFLGPLATMEDRREMARFIGDLHTRGIFPGFGFEVEHDRKDSKRYLAEFFQGGLGLPDRDYYFLDDDRSKQIREAYRAHLLRVLKLNGDDDAKAAAHTDAILAIETELAKVSMTALQRRDLEKTYNKMAPADLERIAPGFPWKDYLVALRVGNPGSIGVRQPEFFTRFAQLWTEKPAADWRAYLRWQLLRATSDKLDTRYESLHFDFYEKTLRGVAQMPSRSKRVLDIISGGLGTEPMAEALGQLYVEKNFPPQAKARAQALVENVKAALADRLKTVDWMTDETRTRSLEKLATMRIKIGYPDRWKDYTNSQVGDLLFVENWMASKTFEHDRNVARLDKSVDKDEWFMSPHLVNAYYDPSGNQIVFPAGILQPPFFDVKADDAVNYGGIGTVIGHEITHGFDDRGRLFDKDGNMRDWWSEEDSRRYKERAKKIEAQYGNFAGIDGIKVNGALTLGENISDVGGVKISYLALHKALAQQKKKPARIDGFTPEQRFFISYAQAWRGKFKPDRERMQLRTGQHSLHPFRVKGPIAHMPEFARAFSCDASKVLLSESERANIW